MIPSRKVAKKVSQRTQVAALCYQCDKKGKVEILLVTSRGTRRWIPPKGWPIEGKSPHDAAAQEALEEAGVKGRVSDVALGRYDYTHDPEQDGMPPAEAFIFPLEVQKFAKDFKEKGQRKVKWFSPKKAALLVREPKLKKILRNFDPRKMGSPG